MNVGSLEEGKEERYRQGTVQRPDRDQSKPEGQKEASFWRRGLEEEGEAGEVEGSQTCWALQGFKVFWYVDQQKIIKTFVGF